jgi:hypothetical protein
MALGLKEDRDRREEGEIPPSEIREDFSHRRRNVFNCGEMSFVIEVVPENDGSTEGETIAE